MKHFREIVRLGLYPSLAVLSTATLIGIFFELDAALSNSAQQAQWAKNHNSCVFMVMHAKSPNHPISMGSVNIATAVRYCNGGG